MATTMATMATTMATMATMVVVIGGAPHDGVE
jgi:hypothetical protein